MKDIKPNISISLSFDSKFILIQFNASDSEHIVKVISLDTLQPIFEDDVTYALWMTESNRLIMVPSYALEELPKTRGLFVYYPEKNKKITVADEYVFTGNIVTGGSKIVGDIIDLKGEYPVFRTLVYDLNGKQ